MLLGKCTALDPVVPHYLRLMNSFLSLFLFFSSFPFFLSNCLSHSSHCFSSPSSNLLLFLPLLLLHSVLPSSISFSTLLSLSVHIGQPDSRALVPGLTVSACLQDCTGATNNGHIVNLSIRKPYLVVDMVLNFGAAPCGQPGGGGVWGVERCG